MRLSVNARFRDHVLTGSQRYASEILARLSKPFLELRPPTPRIGLAGHAWEQTSLLRSSWGTPLWSPCQTGPLLHRNHVVSFLDMAFFDNPGSFSWKFQQWYRLSSRILARRARHIVTISEFSKSRIIHWTGISPEKVTPILLGADASFHRRGEEDVDALLARLELPREPYVLCVGSLEPRKNLAMLLQAWKASADRRPPGVKLFLTGKKGNSEVYASAGLGALPPDVHLTGYVNDADLPALYSGARLFIYPSLYEGFGLPVLEALSCGTPVASSSASSLPEVGGDAVRYFDPQSPAEIASCLVDSLNDPDWLRQAPGRSLDRASRFSWERSAAEHEALLSRILDL